MILYVDVDGTICTNTNGDYKNAVPLKENIEKINSLYNEGNTIVYWTARGSTTGVNWTKVTKSQLKRWGAKHHEVRLGKPHFDLYVCDKSVNAEDFFGSTSRKNNG